MLKILKLIIPVAHCESEMSTLKIEDEVARKLIPKILSIKEDLESMEKYLDRELDMIIARKKNTLNKALLDYSKKYEEMKIKEHASSDSPETNTSLAEILCEIFFVDFLIVYDELSYAINERIMEVYKKYEFIKDALVINLRVDFFEYEKIKEDFEALQYIDHYHFINMLENKLNSNFQICITDMRNILYGCDPSDLESQPEQIQEFYSRILSYENKGCQSEEEIDLFIWLYGVWGKASVIQQQAMSNYIHKFKKILSQSYEYNKANAERFNLSKTRFSLY